MDITATDGYKFSMAEAGAALRQETFYYTHRKGGWHYMPVDVEKYIKSLLPEPTKESYEYLSNHGYDVGASFKKSFSLLNTIKINAIPKGSWFYDREPAFTITGPSAIVSWLEPLILMLQFRIQIATLAKTANSLSDERLKFTTCKEEKEIILQIFDELNIHAPNITVNDSVYYKNVKANAQKLLNIVKDPNRIFEVGMRAVSCMEQHKIALEAIKDVGILRTSNVYLAKELNMIPVGTMGHEHIQRYGNDYDAYIAMRDRFPGFVFYLPDTFDTIMSGIPSALKVISESPERDSGIRFDSEHGILGHYMFTIAKAREMGLTPRLALESGWNDKLTLEFEKYREVMNWPADRQAYGYGGYLVKPEWPTFARDDVAAVWKICQTGSRPTMKFGDEPNSGKQSIPGKPIIWRPHPMEIGEGIPAGYILQEGEDWRPNIDGSILSGKKEANGLVNMRNSLKPVFSPETQKLINQCKKQKKQAIRRICFKTV